MDIPFVGSDAIRNGLLTRGQLRWHYEAVHPDIYLPKAGEAFLLTDATAAWLWTGKRGVIGGSAAAFMHGAKWIEADTTVEIIVSNTRPRPGLIVRDERIESDEIVYVGDVAVTSVARTALDLGRHLPRDEAVERLDALAAATGITPADVAPLFDRYRGARGMRRARQALALMDGGAQSPQETWLRLLLIDAGYPRPRTQIRVTDGTGVAYLDMGYDEPKVGLDYEGAQHADDREQYVHDLWRSDLVDGQGWIDIKVVHEHSNGYILHRVDRAFERRGWQPRRGRRP